MLAYKFLRPGGVGPFSGEAWPRPAEDAPGAWVEASGWTAVCRDGVYGCVRAELPLWIWEELWEIELAGDVAAQGQKLRARRGRLVRRVEAWSMESARAFALACARRAAGHAAVALVAAGEHDLAATFDAAADLGALPPDEAPPNAGFGSPSIRDDDASRPSGNQARPPDDLLAVRQATAERWDRLAVEARVPAGMASDGALRALTANETDDPYVAAHGGAVSAYIAAMTALRVSGPDHVAAERVWQADWLADRLGLTV